MINSKGLSQPFAVFLRLLCSKMKKIPIFIIVLICATTTFSQKVDSISFHLYTDSLKKGQHNYINVDGKLTNGRWLPLTAKEVILSCSEAQFEGNELIIPADFKEEKVTIRAVLKSNPVMAIEKTIWIKKKPDDEWLPTKNDVINNTAPNKNKRNNKSQLTDS